METLAIGSIVFGILMISFLLGMLVYYIRRKKITDNKEEKKKVKIVLTSVASMWIYFMFLGIYQIPYEEYSAMIIPCLEMRYTFFVQFFMMAPVFGVFGYMHLLWKNISKDN